MSPCQLRRATKDFYRAFGRNFMEMFLIPVMDSAYIKKYVRFEGLENIEKAFAGKKGVIFCSVHAGSWELSNIIAANLGFSYSMFVRGQKLPRLEGLLNQYRVANGCRIIQRKDEVRELIRLLRHNEGTGMSCDQGGKNGTRVMFFGQPASMSSGPVRLAAKYGARLLPVFLTRVRGPYLRIFIDKPLEFSSSGDADRDEADNLQKLVSVFERYIERFPSEYLWAYKSWKYSGQRRVLILSDGRTGHLRQSEALAAIAAEEWLARDIKTEVDTVEVRFKGAFQQKLSLFTNIVSGRHICRGCLWCLRSFLEPDTYRALTGKKYDMVISCGSSTAVVNYLISRENNARSLAIMKPPFSAYDRFDLVVVPGHDNPPARRGNVVRTEGALNLITEAYVKEQAAQLAAQAGLKPGGMYVGLLAGGDAKGFTLSPEAVTQACEGLKRVAQSSGARILSSSSRRSSAEIDRRLKQSLEGNPLCGFLVIANEKNYPFAVGGMLGLCRVVVVSPESISMVSEAASSGCHVVVFNADGLSGKHRAFLNSMAAKKLIRLVDPGQVGAEVERILKENAPARKLDDRAQVARQLKKIL
jgi:KDO2-lipid IV(A) lauroyltransferase